MRAQHNYAADNEVVLGGVDSWTGDQPRGVVFCHGAGDLFADPLLDQHPLLLGLSEFATVHVGDLGGDTWANDLGVARVEAAITRLRSWGVTGKVVLVGMSMGHAVACAYAKAYPENVAGIAGVIPLVDIRDGYRFASAGIDAAYPGVKYVHSWTANAYATPSLRSDRNGTVLGTNRVRVPQLPLTGTGGWTGSGGTGAQNTNVGRRLRRTFTSIGSATATSIQCGNTTGNRANVADLAGTGIGVNFQISTRHTYSGATLVSPRVLFFDESATQVGSNFHGSDVTVPPNEDTVLTMRRSVPAGAATVRVDVYYYGSGTAQSNVWIEAWCAFACSEFSDYFDGASVDVLGFSESVDGPVANPAQMNLDPSIAHRIWVAGSDPFTPMEIAQAYVASRPNIELTDIGAWGHTDAAVTAATPQMIEWVYEHSA